jgi:hypothetical protein
VRFFLGAHRARLAAFGIEQAGFLVDRAAILDDVDLAAGFVIDGLSDEADRVDVLDLAARANSSPGLRTETLTSARRLPLSMSPSHVSEITQDGPQLGDVGLRFLGRAHVGPRDDLHQRDAGPVEVDVGIVGVLVVDRLARVLFQVQALDADILVSPSTSISISPSPTIGCLYCEI